MARQPSAAELLAVVERVRPALRRLLAARRVPPQDAQDLVQEALVALVDGWASLDTVASLDAWLIGTLRNRIALYHRVRQARQRAIERLLRELPRSEPAPQTRRDSARDARALTAKLSPRARSVLYFHHGEEMEPEEIARRCGCRAISVRSIAYRALKEVRRDIKGGK